MMNFKEIAENLQKSAPQVKKVKTLIGFDGTVDKIMAVVEKRFGRGEKYTPIKTIKAFGEKIIAASGKSTNLEVFLKQEKIGGNAAIMAGALTHAGAQTNLIADLGAPDLHSIFLPLSRKAKLKTLGHPTETHALEFSDGKIMLCATRNHEAISFERIAKAFGGEKSFLKMMSDSDLTAFVNWTMIPQMTAIFKKVHALHAKKNDGILFFDLADPEKRPVSELKEALRLIGKFSKFKKVILGLNLKEAQQATVVLKLGKIEENEKGVKAAAAKICRQLKLESVVIHTTRAAACATKAGEFFVRGPYTPTPQITTGAGDHFNAGFALGWALKASPIEALTLGVATSGLYVRSGISPKFSDMLAFIRRGW